MSAIEAKHLLQRVKELEIALEAAEGRKKAWKDLLRRFYSAWYTGDKPALDRVVVEVRQAFDAEPRGLTFRRP